MPTRIFLPKFAGGVFALCVAASAIACGGGLRGLAEKAAPIAEGEAPGSAVYASGRIDSKPFGDGAFVEPGAYLRIERRVEVFAYAVDPNNPAVCTTIWTRSPDLEVHNSQACAGQRTRASYVREKTVQPAIQLVHDNGSKAAIGEDYRIVGLASRPLKPTEVTANQVLRVAHERFYIEQSCIEAPRVECERLEIEVTPFEPSATFTAFGVWDGQTIGAGSGEGALPVLLVAGDREAALASIPSE